MGIMPHAVSYYSNINDRSGIYRHLPDDTYQNLLQPSIVISQGDGDIHEAAGNVLPASSLEAGLSRGRAFFGLDKRLGDTIETGAVDHLAGIYKINLPAGDGVNDLDESYNAYWVRLVAIMSLGFEISINPYTLIMEATLALDGMEQRLRIAVYVQHGVMTAVYRVRDHATDYSDACDELGRLLPRRGLC